MYINHSFSFHCSHACVTPHVPHIPPFTMVNQKFLLILFESNSKQKFVKAFWGHKACRRIGRFQSLDYVTQISCTWVIRPSTEPGSAPFNQQLQREAWYKSTGQAQLFTHAQQSQCNLFIKGAFQSEINWAVGSCSRSQKTLGEKQQRGRERGRDTVELNHLGG